MDFVDVLPLELVEEIFQYLSSQDLLNCSLVCVRWRELTNNNRLWARACLKEDIIDKEELHVEESHFENPRKRYEQTPVSSERLAPPCQWREHYNKYKYLEGNWKVGHYTSHRLDVTNSVAPIYYNDGILVVVLQRTFTLYSLKGKIYKIRDITIRYPDKEVDNFLVSSDLIVYSQGRRIICLRGKKFETINEINLACDNVRRRSFYVESNRAKELEIRRTKKYIVVSDELRPTKLFLWNIQTATELEIEVEKIRPSQNLLCTCLEVFNNKVYAAYSLDNCHFVTEYDIASQKWGSKLTVPFRVSEINVKGDLLCAKMYERIYDALCHVYVWSLSTKCELAVVDVNGNEPIVITNDVIIHCKNNTINVHSPKTLIESKFSVPCDTIISMFAVGKHLIAVNTGSAIEIWDWGIGEQLYSVYRGICSSNMWIDDRTVVLCRWSCNFVVIGFW